jgi:carbonic anhydrase
MVLDVQFDKRDRKVEIERLAYTVESPGNFSNLYATDVHGDLYGYTALQFHFHAPSEHYIDGK